MPMFWVLEMFHSNPLLSSLTSKKRENTDWEGNKFAVVQQLQCSPLLLWFSDYDGDLLRFNTVLSNRAFLIINLERLNCHLKGNFMFKSTWLLPLSLNVFKNISIKRQIDSVDLFWFYKQNRIGKFWWENFKIIFNIILNHPFLTSSKFYEPAFSAKYIYDAETISTWCCQTEFDKI